MRKLGVGLCVLALTFAAGCSSSSKTASEASTTAPAGPSTTLDPNLKPNLIPYVVGERIGLSRGWIVTVTKVHRPYTQAGLPAAASGQQYVAVDITMEYQGAKPETVKAADLFTMVDSNRGLHDLVEAAGPNGIDGTYEAGTTHDGKLVYEVPQAKLRLVLAMDGPKVGTQRSIFTIVPPTVPDD